jgi:hypothetical protein
VLGRGDCLGGDAVARGDRERMTTSYQMRESDCLGVSVALLVVRGDRERIVCVSSDACERRGVCSAASTDESVHAQPL